MVYKVTITETLERAVLVPASSKEEAEREAHDRWSDSVYELDAEDFTNVDFTVEEEVESFTYEEITEPLTTGRPNAMFNAQCTVMKEIDKTPEAWSVIEPWMDADTKFRAFSEHFGLRFDEDGNIIEEKEAAA